MDQRPKIDNEIEQLVLHMNVDGKSTKSKTLHRRANDLLSTLAQNIDELKNEMKDGKKESPSFCLLHHKKERNQSITRSLTVNLTVISLYYIS